MSEQACDLNAKFRLGSPEMKRIMIATDVIKYLDAKKIVSAPGTYLLANFARPEDMAVEDNKELDSLLKVASNCDVCALGAIFYAAVIRHDNLKIGILSEFDDIAEGDGYFGIFSSTMFIYLKEFFPQKELCFIEAAFEGNLVNWYDDSDEGDRDYSGIIERCREFSKRFEDPEDRMRAIMQNIIDNNGTFTP